MFVPLTIAYGSTLTALGVGSWLVTERRSTTALIPAFIGVPLIALGAASLVPPWRTFARGSSLVLATAAFGASVPALKSLPDLIQGKAERPVAVIARCTTAAVSAAYILLAGAALRR